MNKTSFIGVLTLGVLLAACSSAESDWKKADAANTVPALQTFIQQHPNDKHVAEAQQRMQSLQDDQAWSTAQAANSAAGFQQYLQQYPSGAHAADANTQLQTLQRASDWKTAQAANTPEALQGFLQKYSSGPEVDQARAQLKSLQDYRVQLATFKNAKEADKARTRLQAKYGSELPDLVVVAPSGSEKQTSVSSAPMTEKDAQAACDKLKKSHQHCEVVKG